MPVPAAIRNHKLATILTVVVALPILVFVLWTTIALQYSYSSGDRAGYLQKLSRKGWLCKTWEGELLLTAMPGAVPEKFVFTVRSDSIATEVNKHQGEHVVLNYEQHKGLPSSCFGETEYFVTGVRSVTTP
ncbi:MAG TPA: hypothetical protein VH277_08845 [Gemmatimonadaceae bacterium]|jgi:hypothetical protein|nr:hypothetical protein [Gemmatimonadaceae bacterium]